MRKFLAAFTFALALSALWASPVLAQSVVVVSGEITADTTWTNNNTYLLSGAVFVRAPAVLTIQRGTLIAGESATNGTLIIDRGAQIMALGTRHKPIVFTSDQPVGQRSRSDWGGLILNGYAPLNVPGGESEGEGDTGTYGGNQPADSSGMLRYVRVEFAGTEFSPDNELNGIAFQGVGNGTVVDYVQVHFNKDDGMEFFGGTVRVKHVLLTANADDSFDWTDGWTGEAQFVIAHQRADDADHGFEADNNAENNNLKPRSAPTIYNVTLIGDSSTDLGDESTVGILLREGTAATIRNAVVRDFKQWGVIIESKASLAEARRGNLSLASTYFFNNGSGLAKAGTDKNWYDNSDDKNKPTWTTADFMGGNGPKSARFADNVQGNADDAKMVARFGKVYRVRNKSVLLAKNGAVVAAPPKGDDFIEETDYIGANGKGAKSNWTRGWTTAALN